MVSATPWSHGDLCRSELEKYFKNKDRRNWRSKKTDLGDHCFKNCFQYFVVTECTSNVYTMAFSGAVFFSTVFPFLNSKNHRPCQFSYHSQSDTAPLAKEFYYK